MMWYGYGVRFRGEDKALQQAPLYSRIFKKLHESYYRRCASCLCKFVEDCRHGYPSQGYATLDDQVWICPICFSKYKEELNLKIVDEATGNSDTSVHRAASQR